MSLTTQSESVPEVEAVRLDDGLAADLERLGEGLGDIAEDVGAAAGFALVVD